MKLRTRYYLYFGVAGLLPVVIILGAYLIFEPNQSQAGGGLMTCTAAGHLLAFVIAIAVALFGLAYLLFRVTIIRIEELNEFLRVTTTENIPELEGDSFRDELSELRQSFVEILSQMRASRTELEENYRRLSFTNMSLEEKYAQSYTIKVIQEEIGRELDTDELLRKTADVVMGVLGSRRCAIYLLDEENENLVVKADSGFGSACDACQRIGIGDSDLIAKSWRDGKIYTEADARPEELGKFSQGRTKKILTIPLNGRKSCLGIMVIEHETIEGIGWDLVEFGETIARELSLSVENAYLYGRMKHMANHDALTGIYNRLYLMTYLAEIFAESPDALAVLIFDLDHFKKVNDQHGHLVGDTVLRKIGALIQRQLPQGILARYGGEEFIAVLPNMESEPAQQLAEQLRLAVAEQQFAAKDGTKFNVTISIGLASYPNLRGGYEQILQQADNALYQAKKAGRNRVCSAAPPPAQPTTKRN